MYANTRGLHSKKICIQDMLDENKPDIFLLTETQLKSDMGIKFKGYCFFGKQRISNTGGGVGILVKEELKTIVAPYYSERNLEIIWVTLKSSNNRPIFFGSYYGKQESCPKAEIEMEMMHIQEEIKALKNEGEIFLAMDGNGKIGILNEKTSRNGHYLLSMFEQTGLYIINESEKCEGRITRQNPRKPSEVSAIDFIVTTAEVENYIQNMKIDEEGLLKVKGKNESDHNTITVKMKISHENRFQENKEIIHLNARPESWKCYREKIKNLSAKTDLNLATNPSDIYSDWIQKIETAASSTLGTKKVKTTNEFQNYELKKLRKERRFAKMKFQHAPPNQKVLTKEIYISKQNEVRDLITTLKAKRIEKSFKKMIEDKSQTQFWKERKKYLGTDKSDWNITKDNINGRRLFTPEENMDNIANFYENLYKKTTVPYHPYHDEIIQNMKSYENDYSHEDLEINAAPTREEIKKAIMKRKNGKATTDIKNELIKGGGEYMTDMIHEWALYFWNTECPPQQWNEGKISTIWKKRGDRELLTNHRGITVSSTVNMIIEDVIDGRIETTLKFTKAQGGGRKNFSTADHVFCLRAIMDIAIYEKKPLFITFFDVKKAYDHADMNHMLDILWKHGIRGKLWRLTKALNENLTARVKTKFGLTRQITRELGGKQGGKLMTKMFAKLIDTIEEEALEKNTIGIQIDHAEINSLDWVDDVATAAIGHEQQKETLEFVNSFAIKQKLEWGIEKCNVLQVGKETITPKSWSLGEEQIESAMSYKYLGDIICRDGKNTENVKKRAEKLVPQATAIIASASNEVMRKVEVRTLLKLHESISIPSVLTNCETWVLTEADKNILDSAEVKSLKRILNLPEKTPTNAIRAITGTWTMGIRIQVRQLLYLKKILTRNCESNSKILLNALKERNIGWAKYITRVLNDFDLIDDWAEIQKINVPKWKKLVHNAADKKQIDYLKNECMRMKDSQRRIGPKTASLYELLQDKNYQPRGGSKVLDLEKIDAKCIIMSRHGMLLCAKNYRNRFNTNQCKVCKTLDDENHRANVCSEFQNTNRLHQEKKIDFSKVFSENTSELKSVSRELQKIWDLSYNQNSMKS